MKRLLLLSMILLPMVPASAEPLILEEDFSAFDANTRPKFFAPGGEIRAENGQNYLHMAESGTIIPNNAFRAGKLHDFRLRLNIRFPDLRAKEARLTAAFRIPGAWDEIDGHYTLTLNPYAVLLKFIPKTYGNKKKYPARKTIPVISLSNRLTADAWTVLEVTAIGPKLSIVLEDAAGKRTEIYTGEIPDITGNLSIQAEDGVDVGGYTVTHPTLNP